MKKLFSTLFILIISGFSLPVSAVISSPWPTKPMDGVTGALKGTAIKTSDLATFLGTILAYLWPILGLALVIFIIYAGFLWMTAMGNEDQIKKAKGIIKNCLIGLVIILLAYTITTFVLSLVK